jgi:hypothetical protein
VNIGARRRSYTRADVSRRSGHRVLGALLELGHEATLIDPGEIPLAENLQERAPDLCYLALYGKEGEDGTIQRLLDLLDLAYTGTAAFDCEIAFDKLLAKDALARAGVRTPVWAPIEASALRDLGAGSTLGRVTDRVGLPCVVKPSRSGSALGVSTVSRERDLPAAVMSALSFSGAACFRWEPAPSVWTSQSCVTRSRGRHSHGKAVPETLWGRCTSSPQFARRPGAFSRERVPAPTRRSPTRSGRGRRLTRNR